MQRDRRLLDPVAARLAEQSVFLGQGLVPFGLGQDQLLERRQGGIVAQQG